MGNPMCGEFYVWATRPFIPRKIAIPVTVALIHISNMANRTICTICCEGSRTPRAIQRMNAIETNANIRRSFLLVVRRVRAIAIQQQNSSALM